MAARKEQNDETDKKCGREPRGAKVAELGVCPAATETALDGTNGGGNAGRACWAIAGTLCGGKVQGSYALKLSNCLQCEFYRLVAAEEGPNHENARGILAKLAEAALARR
jgi:hypothetical protein